jgi:hypothetical protein
MKEMYPTRDRTQSLSITGSATSQLGYVRICDKNTASNIYELNDREKNNKNKDINTQSVCFNLFYNFLSLSKLVSLSVFSLSPLNAGEGRPAADGGAAVFSGQTSPKIQTFHGETPLLSTLVSNLKTKI